MNRNIDIIIEKAKDMERKSKAKTFLGNEEEKRIPLAIRKRGKAGNKVIPLRIREELLADIDRIAQESHCLRNELINFMLADSVEKIKIE